MHKIFVIDDSPTDLKIIERILGNAGFNVVLFDNAKTAVSKVGQQKPDILVTDIVMRGMDGIDTAKILREKYPKLPIIAYSGHTIYHGDAAWEFGVNAVVKKEPGCGELIGVIKELLAA